MIIGDGSKEYFDFLDILGERIELKGWKKYRGDIGAEIGKNQFKQKI